MGSLQQLSVVKGCIKPVKFQYLHKIFEENVDRMYGQKVAVLFKGSGEKERTTTYNVLNSTANRMAHILMHRIQAVNKASPNLDGDFIIAVCMKPSDNLIFTLLAIWKAGAAYLPLDPTFPKSRIDHIMNEAKPVLVVYDDADATDPSMFGVDAINISALKATSANEKNSNIPVEKNLTKGTNDLAIVLYTSGSTGVPKGCRLPHAIIQNRLEWQYQRFPFSSTEVNAVFKTALTFVDSVAEIFGPLLNGLRLIVVPKEITVDPEKLVAILEEYRIERLVLVPTLLRSLLMYLPLQDRSDLLHNLKIWVCSGEPLAVSLAKQFFDYFIEGVHVLCNFYGSTEIMGDVSYFVCESRKQLDNFEKGVPIGVPVNNTIIYLLDTHLNPVKIDEIGELYCSGLNLIKGYVNGRDPDRFIENPLAVDPAYARLYRTGDFASFQKGNIVYEGRTDSQIKIRGMRVDLSEVEKSLFSLPGIDKAIVLCYHAGEVDQALLAFATLATDENGKELYQNGLQVEVLLKEKLPVYMVPQVMLIDTVPLLVNGKVDRQSLLKMYENTNNNDDSAIALEYDYSGIADSQMAIAKDLFETVGRVLGRSCRKKITKYVNFYELGGNSLNSIYTVTELRDKNYYISITNFLAAENLGQVLSHICNASNPGADGISDAAENNMNLKAFPLAREHKADTIDIITRSFFEKADLEQWLKPNIRFTDYGDILEDIWDVLIEKGLSFIVKDGNGRSVGVSMNFDARDEPEVNVKSKLLIVFEFLEFLEGPIRDEQLPPGKILHSFMMGTNSELNAQDNVTVMNFMESEVLLLARSKKFAGIFTTNTNPLTQQLGTVYGYKTMLDYQVNQYQYTDGTRPFGRAPKEQRAIVHWKDIRQ